MFLPARMTRLLVGGHVKHRAGAIEVLHQEKAVHLEDFHDPTGSTRIGTPLPHGAEVSELLVRLRGIQKALGAEGAPAKALATAEPARILAEADAAVSPTLQRTGDLRSRLQAAAAEEALLTPFAGLDVDLSFTVRSLKAFVGTAKRDPTPGLTSLAAETVVVPGPRGFAVAAYVAHRDVATAEKLLAEAGFQSAELPKIEGTPAERLAALAAERGLIETELAGIEAETASLRDALGPRLAALENLLVSEVDKTQAPLHFGETPTTFHIEGWVPTSRVNRVKNALAGRFGDALYVEELGDAPTSHDAAAHAGNAGAVQNPGKAHGGTSAHGVPTAHGADGGHGAPGDGHGDGHEAHHGTDAKDEPPVHLENPKAARPYEWILGLLGSPRYKEFDPTKLMFVFFPLFFGLMVGDLLVGLAIVLFGWWLLKNKLIGIGGPAVGKALIAGGIVAAFCGVFVFGEALGIHFVVDDHAAEEGEMSWENIFGLHVPDSGFLHKTGGHAELAPDGALADGAGGLADGTLVVHAEEAAAHGSILSPHSDVHLSLNGWVNLGYYSKIHDVQALLVWSLIIGVVHISLGLIIGTRNVYVDHGATLAIQEKAAWLLLMAGTAVAVLFWGGVWGYVGAGVILSAITLLWMGAAKVLGQGYISLLEIPSLIGNLVSYTRLAAIGASKAGLGLALGAICFETMGGGWLGWSVYMLGFVGIIALAVLSGGLQSLRLQFVEFFGKFFQGGGRPYVPFGRRAT